MKKSNESKISQSGYVHAEYAELIGDICITWNHLEDVLPNLAAVYLNFELEISQPVFAALSNNSRIDLLKHLVSIREKDPARRLLMEHFAEAFNICRENRNIVVHSAVRSDFAQEEVYLYKDSKRHLGTKTRYAYSIETTRNVLSEIKQTLIFGQRLFMTATLPFAYWGALSIGEKVDPEKLLPEPLPDKPSLPTRLGPLPPASPRNAPPQPPQE